MKHLAFAAAILLSTVATAAQKDWTLASPGGELEVRIAVADEISYSVVHGGEVMVAPSPISMTLEDGTTYGKKPGRATVRTSSVDEVIRAELYKKTEIRDCYNQMTLKFKTFTLVFRAYDEGIAYRFISGSEKDFKVVSEEAVFNFPAATASAATGTEATAPAATKAYIPYVTKFDGNGFGSQFNNSFENTYEYIPLAEFDSRRLAFLPVLVEGSQGRKICITEADLQNYPGMYLNNPDGGMSLKGVFAAVPDKVEQGGHNNLQGLVTSRKPYIAECGPGEVFPWRVIIVSKEDKELADNDLVYKLAEPAPEGMDFSWVKPGKVAWDWWNDWNIYGVDFKSGINNETYEYYIDFASEHGIEYVILDEGWAVKGKADLMQVVPEIDLERLAAYAQKKNVGLILWAGYLAFDRDMENVCKHFSEMGIKGFKVDFMDRDDQEMVRFHARAAQVAAKYHLMLDFHGTYKPTGLHRTWPNVVNYEGVHGLEQMKWSSPETDQVTYDVTIPYIRMLAGPMDYTQGAMRNAAKGSYKPFYSEPMSQGTRCRQLAEYIIFEAPLNMLCDSPSNYMAETICTDFISNVPEVWDETIALDGKVGEYVVMARRKGDTWYIGGMTDWNARTVDLDLSFLSKEKLVMDVYRDGVNADKAARDFSRKMQPVPDSRKVTMEMAPGGGFAIVVHKVLR